MKIYESGENYLETILILRQRNGSVRSIDIVNELGFSKPSISKAMGILRQEGFIDMDRGGEITLTPKGEQTADEIYCRHMLIRSFLLKLGVEEPVADKDACRIEHIVSEQTLGRMQAFLEPKKNELPDGADA